MIVLSLRYMLAICSAGVFVFVGNAYSRDVCAYSVYFEKEPLINICWNIRVAYQLGDIKSMEAIS